MRFCHETSRCPNPRPESEWFWEHNYLWIWKYHQGSQYEQHDTPSIFFGRLWIFIFLRWIILHLPYFDVIEILLQLEHTILVLGLFCLLDLQVLVLSHEKNSKEFKYTQRNCHYNKSISSKKRLTICVSNWREFPIVFWLAYNLLLRISLALAKESVISTFCLGRP